MFRKGIFPLSRRWILEALPPLFSVLNPKCPPKWGDDTNFEWIDLRAPKSDWYELKKNITLEEKIVRDVLRPFLCEKSTIYKKSHENFRWAVPTYLEIVSYSECFFTWECRMHLKPFVLTGIRHPPVLAPFGLKNVEILKKVLWFSNYRTRKTIFWWIVIPSKVFLNRCSVSKF